MSDNITSLRRANELLKRARANVQEELGDLRMKHEAMVSMLKVLQRTCQSCDQGFPPCYDEFLKGFRTHAAITAEDIQRILDVESLDLSVQPKITHNDF